MYSAWVEEDVDDIPRMLCPVEPFSEGQHRRPISRKLNLAAEIVECPGSDESEDLPGGLEAAAVLFERKKRSYTWSDWNGI